MPTLQIEVPSLPVAHMRALQLIRELEPTVEELSSVADADPGLTAAVLRAANSAVSSPVERVRTARAAIVRMGTVEARRMILGVALGAAFRGLGQSDIDERELWRHLIATALIADATSWGEIRHSEAFTVGLLHDIGRMAMAAQDAGMYRQVVNLARVGMETIEAERMVFGLGHVEWGEAISRAWGFPNDIVDAIGDHHVGTRSGLGWVVQQARMEALRLGIGDGVTTPEEPPPDAGVAPVPVIEHLGGADAVLRRIDRYGAAMRAA